MGSLSLDAMSINQVVIFVAWQFPIGISTAGNVYSGQLLGANKPAEAINAIKVFVTLAGKKETNENI